jgi:F-box interacting protein
MFYPSFAFLPDYRRLDLIDCCNGLLLCYWDDADTTRRDDSYIVCNPATQQWMALPDLDPSEAGGGCIVGTTRLGFEPAVSSHFHVFLLMEDARSRNLTGVYVYSSETGTWIYKEKGWNQDVRLVETRSATVFLNGCLHFRTQHVWEQACLAAVDTKGGTWSSFETPCDMYNSQCHGFIQQLHGHLNYVSLTIDDDCDELYLKIYALEDYANKRWTLKHRINVDDDPDNAFGGTTQEYFDWIAIHPDCNLIFFVRGPEKKVSNYSIDLRTVWEIHTLKEGHPPYLPYVPLYSELESLHK